MGLAFANYNLEKVEELQLNNVLIHNERVSKPFLMGVREYYISTISNFTICKIIKGIN